MSRYDRPVLVGGILQSWPPEWELGLICDNPLRYSLSLLQMFIGASLLCLASDK
jgi:hypothetical protein